MTDINEELYDDEYHAAVDIPKVDSNGRPADEWYCVEYFKTKEEAIAYARFHYGADENGMVCLVSTF